MEDCIFRRIDHVFDAGLQTFEPWLDAGVDRWEEEDANARENDNGENPFAVKAIFHSKDYKTKDPKDFRVLEG